MARKRSSRFRKAKDAQKQLEQIEEAQQAVREGKLPKRIDSIEKSKQRFRNSLKKIRKADDVRKEFD
jgi:hypothetical protein